MFKKVIINFILNIVPAIFLGWAIFNISNERGIRAVIRSPQLVFGFILIILVLYFVIKYIKVLYLFILKKFDLREYWAVDFYQAICSVIFVFSFFGLIYFSRSKNFEIVIIFLMWLSIYFILLLTFKKHPDNSKDLVTIHNRVFLLSTFIFLLSIVFQWFALKYHFVIGSNDIKNIVVYRSIVLVSFWVIFLSIATLLYEPLKKIRHWPLILWLVIYLVILALSIINTGLLFYSGLYISPVILEHATGGGAVIFSSISIPLFILLLITPIVLFFFVFMFLKNGCGKIQKKYKQAYFYSLLVISVVSLVIFYPFSGNFPEKVIVSTFINYYFNSASNIVLNDVAIKKLEKFGLFYDQSEFIVSGKSQITTSTNNLLGQNFIDKKPNIIFISLESFSSRLTGDTGGNISGLTPNIDAFANSNNVTVFDNFYNASTPTVTGLIAQLCSFLPPTGHQEIGKANSFNNYLICLPSILKKNGYNYSAYITAVEKEYVGKNTIFKAMGFDNIYGASEILVSLNQKPESSWGASDHQSFPFLKKIVENKSEQPFFLMLSTVDSHQPFNMSKDVVKYSNGDSDLLNSIHSTDDAVGIFLNEFDQTELASNTIVILVGDHALFPNSYPEKYFPEINKEELSYYDRTVFMMRVPGSILPKRIKIYSSSIDIAPTIMDLLGINNENYFDGHSIFADREKYPNILGMHEFGLYINQVDNLGNRIESYTLPQEINCVGEAIFINQNDPLSLCEYLEFYKWKRKMMSDSRLWLKK